MKKSVELYVGYSDNTWNTMIVEVPINTPYNALEHVAEEEATKICWEKKKRIVSFASICSTNPEEFGE
jgi:hypothetical protein